MLQRHEVLDDLAAGGVEDRVGDLDAALGVARHHVRRAQIDHVGVGAEGVDARVLEEAPHDLTHLEAVGLAGDAGLDARDAADGHLDVDACLAGLGYLVDDVAVGKGVHLEEDLRRLASPRAPDLAVDAAHDERLERKRRHAEVLVLAAEVAEREVAEEHVAVLGDAGVCGEQHEVGVEAGGLLVEVARAEACDAADARGVVVGHLADLRVALEALGAVDHRAAGVLEALRPRDVVRLVEAGAQLHEDGDVLAVLGGRDEALAQVAALGHAIEGDLDLDAGVVGRGLAEERKQGRHRLVRVGKKDVVVLDLLAHGPAVDDHVGGLGLKGMEDDLGPVEVGDAALKPVDVAEVERAVDLEDAARLQAELVGHEGLELLAERALELEAHRLEALAELEDLLHVLAVVLLLLDALAVRVDVGVAGHAKHRRLLGPEVAEAGTEAGSDHVLDEGVAVALARGGELDHAVLGRRHLDDAQKAGL